MKKEDVKPGRRFKHREPRPTEHEHIVLYVALYTENGADVVVHRPTHKTEIIYCEPMDHFVQRFSPK